ncbi:MAG: hypothetical protein ACQETI_02620 [Halobacteriota archaeon]
MPRLHRGGPDACVVICRELDDTERSEFLEIPVHLSVIAVDESSSLADTFWALTGDDVEQLEVRPTHESFDVVKLLEVEDERCPPVRRTPRQFPLDGVARERLAGYSRTVRM